MLYSLQLEIPKFLFVVVMKFTSSDHHRNRTSSDPDQQSDLVCVGRNLRWHLDMASFWTETCGGVQAEEGAQRALVGQGDRP